LTKDERRILSWGGNELRLWDAATGQEIGPAMKHEHAVRGTFFTKDERRVLSWKMRLVTRPRLQISQMVDSSPAAIARSPQRRPSSVSPRDMF